MRSSELLRCGNEPRARSVINVSMRSDGVTVVRIIPTSCDDDFLPTPRKSARDSSQLGNASEEPARNGDRRGCGRLIAGRLDRRCPDAIRETGQRSKLQSTAMVSMCVRPSRG